MQSIFSNAFSEAVAKHIDLSATRRETRIEQFEQRQTAVERWAEEAGAVSPQGTLTKENELRQTLFLHRSHLPLRIGVQIRAVGRQRERLDLARLDDRPERLGVFCVAVMQEIAAV
jgi:hypothetical protein